ncbi:hypothetical protein [Thalassotalea piscium]|uniref:HPt domain-containing protein n=1 Tax=Thalassotalea piscium TaxID=1230533 RepID=A0A7X0TTD8_9GAMM|nr:hypothetical protein [Thalassotalea piscium]MBB6543152.1 hypothetical protein [Thalassotalea piscium]
MTNKPHCLIIDNFPIGAQYTKQLLINYCDEVHFIKDIHTEAKIKALKYDLVIIPSYYLRDEMHFDWATWLNDIQLSIVHSPTPLLDVEAIEVNKMGFTHHVEINLLDVLINDLLFKEPSPEEFSLSKLLEQGLLIDEAIQACEIALPKLMQTISRLETEFYDLKAMDFLHEVHKTHGLLNYCGLLKAKNKLEPLELDLKESLEKNIAFTQHQYQATHDIINDIKDHILVAKNTVQKIKQSNLPN